MQIKIPQCQSLTTIKEVQLGKKPAILKLVSSIKLTVFRRKIFDGVHGIYTHFSTENACIYNVMC